VIECASPDQERSLFIELLKELRRIPHTLKSSTLKSYL
jgi:hypothetical protein